MKPWLRLLAVVAVLVALALGAAELLQRAGIPSPPPAVHRADVPEPWRLLYDDLKGQLMAAQLSQYLREDRLYSITGCQRPGHYAVVTRDPLETCVEEVTKAARDAGWTPKPWPTSR